MAAGEGTRDVPSAARRVAGFRPTYVFDVAQTTGEPLPEPPTPQLLVGEAPPGLWDALAAQVAAAGYSLERGPCDDANGVTIPATRTVRVRDDIDDAQAVKTLAHELAHVLLHTHRPQPRQLSQSAQSPEPSSEPQSVSPPAGDPAALSHPEPPGSSGSSGGLEQDGLRVTCRGRAEVEAESVAFLVTATYGLDSSTYTYPYVTSWAHGVPGRPAGEVVRATGERVLATARQITSAISEGTIAGIQAADLTATTSPDILHRAGMDPGRTTERQPLAARSTSASGSAPGSPRGETAPARADAVLQTRRTLQAAPGQPASQPAAARARALRRQR